MEDTNPLEHLKRQGRVFDEELLELAPLLHEQEPVQFDEFQAYVGP